MANEKLKMHASALARAPPVVSQTPPDQIQKESL